MMNRSTILIALVLLLAGILVVVFETGGGDAGGTRSEDGRSANQSKSELGGNRDRVGDPAKRVRALLKAGPKGAPSFASVEDLVARLSQAELESLRDECITVRPDSVGGWIRCAVFAELARRDPEGAFEFLTTDESNTKSSFWGMRQAWFSTMRGWSEVDGAGAAAKMLELVGNVNVSAQVTEPIAGLSMESYVSLVPMDGIWKHQALQEVYAQYAKVDPEAAWAALPEGSSMGYRDSATEGFFRGLSGHELLPSFIERWEREALFLSPVEFTTIPGIPAGSGEAVSNIQTSTNRSGRIEAVLGNPGRVGLGVTSVTLDLVLIEGDLRVGDFHSYRSHRWHVASQVAQSLSALNDESATEWMEDREGPLGPFMSLAYHEDLARDDPARALQMINDTSLSIVGPLLREHPDRASEVFSRMEDRDARVEEIETGLRMQATVGLGDLMPSQREPSRLPNYEERYELLMEAVQSGGFNRPNEERLLQRVHEAFAEVIPGARESIRVEP